MATAEKTSLQNFIGGEFVDPAEGQTEEVLNPATGEAIAEAPLSGEEDVNRAVAAARGAFEGWATTTPGERSAALLKLADAIEENADEISDLEAANAGKPRSAFLDDEIPFMVDNLRFFAGAARNLEGKASGEYTEGYTSIIRRQPVGVIGQIAPWNYPLMMGMWKIGPALATGNTVVLKPAETTPVSTLKLAELAADIFPPGRAQRDHRARRAGGLVARDPPRGGHGVAHGLARHGQVDRQGGLRHAEEGAPRARRQGARGGVRRRGHGDRAGDDRRHRLLQRRPGLHGGHARARRQGRLRRRGLRAHRAGQGTGAGRHVRRRHHARARSTRRCSASAWRASSSASPTTPRW